MAVKGVDVSTYQTNVDFKKLKAAGVDFVIIRAGYGDYLSFPGQKDHMFESHYKNAKAAGLHVGAYWFCYSYTPEAAKREAKGFLEVIKGKQFDYPVYLDLETNGSYSPFSTGKTNCTAMVKAFCDVLEDAGYWAGLYISRSPLTTHISTEVANRYSLWVAEYGPKCNYNGTVDIWQYTSTQRYNGYSGNLDGDVSYKDYPTLIKNAGKNGYSKPTTKKTLDAEGMKEGDKNLGVYELKSLLSLLEKAKYITTHISIDDGFGSGTTAVVNGLLKKWGYTENGIAGRHFINQARAIITSKL